jgi:hypothetical protein
MDAPLYLAADHFVPPVRQPRVLNTRDVAIADLMAIPEVWAQVMKSMPQLAMAMASSMLKPHLGNFSLRDLAAFGATTDTALDQLDVMLQARGMVK